MKIKYHPLKLSVILKNKVSFQASVRYVELNNIRRWLFYGWNIRGTQSGADRQATERGAAKDGGPTTSRSSIPRDVSSLGRSIACSAASASGCTISCLISSLRSSYRWTGRQRSSTSESSFPCGLRTVRIAEASGLPHARYKGTPQVLSSDFLVDFDDSARPAMAIQAKYSSDLEKPEVIERLELERRYWAEKGVPWAIVTEREVSKTAFANIQWLYPVQSDDELSLDELDHYQRLYLHEFQRDPDRTLTTIAQGLDMAYGLEPGTALYWLRQLLAQHYFPFRYQQAVQGAQAGGSRRQPPEPTAGGTPCFPVNQVFRIDEHRRRLLWCDAELAIWIDIDSTTALPTSIPITDLERLLIDRGHSADR